MKKSDLYAHGNPYGYRYNVNHPWVQPIYREYCRGIGARSGYPLTDLQRRGFDQYLEEHIQKKRGRRN